MTKQDKTKPTGAGKSSFGLIDTAKFFQALELKKGVTFLDVACGRGNYSMAAAEIIGPNGRVFALDLWEEGILSLRNEAAKKVSEILPLLSAMLVNVSRLKMIRWMSV